ncbi:hypothetical protein GCK32_009326 [Trichostrongylus colubriformis]|uniref:Endoplasmic reticulum junction formation protein lunapark n=1 Tax=Trichostrongylus colubriformis TaxID=6319 RepID=A0AAN8IHY5_TRICO
MGNILKRRKKVVTEELESLSHQMKAFREDIEKTAEAKRMTLWYLTLTTFFFSSSIVAYAWITFERKEHKVLFAILSFVAGLVLLWLGRKAANAFFNWRINRKRQGLDSLVARKRDLLETVKETETFKVAKEILEKYDQESPKSASQPSSPSAERKNPPDRIEQFQTPGEGKAPVPLMMSGPPRLPVKKLFTKSSENISTPEGTAMKTPVVTRINPIRPFQREGTTAIDKLVDYFFGDGPGQRNALICSSCHGHNGMALPAEYDYLAYVCYICGHFNPARKFRPGRLSGPPAPPASNLQTAKSISTSDTRAPAASLDSDVHTSKEDEKKEKADDSFDDLSDEHLPEPSAQS